jgi:diguanylate cyclase (GGDEF)-like protein
MPWRVSAAMALLAAALVVATLAWAIQAQQAGTERQSTVELASVSRSYAEMLRARLAASQLLLQGLAGSDSAIDAAGLRPLQDSAMFRGVVLDNASAAAAVQLDAAGRLALSSGQTLLRYVPRAAGQPAVYMLHALRSGNRAVIGYFELSPAWLWQDFDVFAGPRGTVFTVIDDSGTLLRASAELPLELLDILRRERGGDAAAGSSARSWSVRGAEWRGAVATILAEDERLAGGHWTVIASRPAQGLLPALRSAAGVLPFLLGLAAALCLATYLHLRRSWQRILADLTAALRELAHGRYGRVGLDGARDEPREVAIAYNRAIGALEDRMRAMVSLNEIDRLLLESGDIEGCLDRVLERVAGISCCDVAMLALLDQDATDRGRAFIFAHGHVAPVTRIGLDTQLLAELMQERAGLTVLRIEPGRHSLLEPMQERGADFYWLWPVLAQDSLAAVLAVGYRSAPLIAEEIAGYGTECALRLGVAMSNSARGEQLYRQAHFDPLTSLPNRLLFRDRLSQELASATQGRQRGALLYIDLDHFKKINDTVGHGAGDQVLQVVAQRLRACVKEGDTVARLGGDEFTIILRGIGGPDGAQRVAQRLVEALKEPVNVGGRDYPVGASVGVTLFPDDGTQIDDLMRNADLAMYQAKQEGRGRAVFYDRAMQRMPALAAESGLYRALQRREFSLYYQPQYSLADGALVGLEALLRWQPPREAMRYPGEFVPAAEQSGLIVDIGAWVLDAACEQLSRWIAEGLEPPRVALNVSVFQLRQADFPRLVRRALERTGLDPAMLEIELTESVFADEDARATMRRLAALGIRLALDDFGTGYSSLGYLREHPVQTIKIDRSFIEEVTSNVTAATLAETMITMAHALGKQVVAEGVETMEQLDFLRSRRCDYAQGYFLARPASAGDVTQLLQGRLANRDATPLRDVI